MTDLGDVIALLLSARDRYRTVRATLSVRYEARNARTTLRHQHGKPDEAAEVPDDWPETEPRARKGILRVWLALDFRRLGGGEG